MDAEPTGTGSDVELAHRAAGGEKAAQREVAALADNVARVRAAKYCKRFCGRNRLDYFCTVDSSFGVQRQSAPRCEWGSFSYFFFFDRLVNPNTLSRFEGREGTTLQRYFRAVAGSLGLWERWKNKRFQRRVHLPKVVAGLGEDAAAVYYGLRDGDAIENMAQRLRRSEADVRKLAATIRRVLAQERRAYQEQEFRELSLSGGQGRDDEEDAADWEPESVDPPIEHVQMLERLSQVLPQLTWIEQFIVQAMIMESMSAEAVLHALCEENIEIKPGQFARDVNINQIYYLRDKTLTKLRRMCHV